MNDLVLHILHIDNHLHFLLYMNMRSYGDDNQLIIGTWTENLNLTALALTLFGSELHKPYLHKWGTEKFQEASSNLWHLFLLRDCHFPADAYSSQPQGQDYMNIGIADHTLMTRWHHPREHFQTYKKDQINKLQWMLLNRYFFKFK